MPRADAIIVGGGHNGLVCAAYLTKAGLSVIVLEQKNVAGGCVVTEEVLPEWKVNTYSFEHYVIQNTPIVSELSLENFGLKYYSVDPAVFCPFPDNRYMLLYRDLQKTLKHLENLSKKDSKAYEKFHAKWAKVAKALALGAFAGPAPFESILANSGLFTHEEMSEIKEESKLPAAKILSENFETEFVPVVAAFLGPAAIGLSPSAANTGWLCAWHVGAENLARPYGGSGMLTQALARSAQANGALILLGEKVKQIIVHNGKVMGVRTVSGKTFESEIVASNADPKQTMLKLADYDGALSSEDRRMMESVQVSRGFAFKADYLLKSLPEYACKETVGDLPNEFHRAATFIAPSVKALSAAFEEYSAGKNPSIPGLMVALHSATDPSLVPSGKHSLILETRYTPYRLHGMNWTEEDVEEQNEKLLSLYGEYCPGVEDLVEHSRSMSPRDMEKDVMLPGGNFLHADMNFDQMFEKRPISDLLDGYAVQSIQGLYICGSGAFPGGAVSGIPGHNAAMQILQFLRAAQQS